MGQEWLDESCGMVKLILPWPPSVNTYWRRNGSRYFVSSKGIKYRDDVISLARSVKLESQFSKNDRLTVSIEAYPPDKRRRDLDNILKSLLDSLQHAGVYADDSQIDQLTIQRHTPLNSEVIVNIKVCDYQGISSSTILGS